MSCYCGSEKPFEECCGSIISKQNATSPLELMRSRFSAFATANGEYILATENPTLHEGVDAKTLTEQIKNQSYFKLEIKAFDEKSVHFVAHFIADNAHQSIDEHSLFALIDDKWRYEKAIHFEHNSSAIKRNEKCPCGSGKKFKQCHMR